MRISFKRLTFGLRGKFILAITLLIIFTSLVLSIFLIRSQTQLIKKELEKEGEFLVRNLAVNSEYAVLIGNRALLLDLIRGPFLDQNVAYIIIQDRSGKTLAQLDKEVISKLSSEKRNQIISLPVKTDASTQKHLISDKIGTFWNFSTPILTTNIRREKEEIGMMMEESRQEVEKEMIGIVRVGISLSPMEKELAQIKMIISLLTLLVVAFGVGFTIFLVNLIIKPIDNLVEATKTIAEGDLSLSVFPKSKDEIGELSQSFKQMVENLKKSREKIDEYNRNLEQMVEERTIKLKAAQAQLLQSEKLSAIGQLISGVAHELNNPLTSVLGFSQLLLSKEKNHKTEKYLNKITQEAERCAKIVNNLLTFSRTYKPEKSYVGINGIIERTLDLMAYQFRTENIEVIKKLDPHLPKTMADFHQLQQVFLNIINNAFQAMKDKRETGILTVETERSGLVIRIKFSDTGPGIPKENLTKVFDPFFTTKEVGKGTGLGLSISYGIVKEHGGDIYVLSELGKGACFVVELPIIEDSSKSAFPQTSQGELIKSVGGNILVIDDEEDILDLFFDFLSSEGYRVDTAKTGEEALRKIKKEDYDIVFCDLKMPGIDGQQIYKYIQEEKPQMLSQVVFSTGAIASLETKEFFQKTKNRVLAKPFNLNELKKMVIEMLENSTKKVNV